MTKLVCNSLPKSGTNLIDKLLLASGYSYSGVNFSSTNVRGKNTIAKQLLRGHKFYAEGLDVGLDVSALVSKKWVIDSISKVQDRQFMSGHFPYSDQMNMLLKDAGLIMLYMVRDPRDVILSWAHYVPKQSWHYGSKGLIDKDLDSRVLALLHGYRSGTIEIEGFQNVLRRIEGWMLSDTTHVVRFEQLVGEKGGGSNELQRACISEIMTHIGEGNPNLDHLSNNLFGGTQTFRKGKIGSWIDELSSRVIDELNNTLGDSLERMGYE